MNNDERIAQLGELIVLYRPSPLQTVVGMVVSLIGAVLLVIVGIMGWGLNETNRGGAIVGAVVCVGLAWVIYRQRRWRLALFEHGITQIQPNRIEELRWAAIQHVVELKMKHRDDVIVQLTLTGTDSAITVNPINYRERWVMFQTILEQARKRNIPVRTEWQSTD